MSRMKKAERKNTLLVIHRLLIAHDIPKAIKLVEDMLGDHGLYTVWFPKPGATVTTQVPEVKQ